MVRNGAERRGMAREYLRYCEMVRVGAKKARIDDGVSAAVSAAVSVSAVSAAALGRGNGKFETGALMYFGGAVQRLSSPASLEVDRFANGCHFPRTWPAPTSGTQYRGTSQ